MGTVHLRSLSELQHALRKLGYQGEREMVQAMMNAGRFGATAVLRQSAQTTPRPKASGTYERSWLVQRLRDGSVLSNSSQHSFFVERGRRRGKAPPLQPIMEWVWQKRLLTKGMPRPRSRRKKRKVTPMALLLTMAATLQIARGVQRKIARHGTPGRFVLRNTMPRIARRVRHEVRVVVRRLANTPPR